MTYYDELDSFMGAVRMAQVGTRDDKKLYAKATGRVGDVPLLGPYGIRADEWVGLTEQAGIPGAKWQDRTAQEAVMRYKFTQLYNQYGGKWDGVAVAWKAGDVAADLIVNQGHPIEAVVGEGSSILSSYVADTMVEAQEPMGGTDVARQAMDTAPFANAGLMDEASAKPVQQKQSADEAVTNVLTSMRDQQIARAPEPEEGGMTDGNDELGVAQE